MDEIDQAFEDWYDLFGVPVIKKAVRRAWLDGAHWGVERVEQVILEEKSDGPEEHE